MAAELYVGDSLAMIREAGVDDLQENPNAASCTNRFLRGLQTDVARAGLLCGCNLTTVKQKYERELSAFVFPGAEFSWSTTTLHDLRMRR